jgi:hypothetical protein
VSRDGARDPVARIGTIALADYLCAVLPPHPDGHFHMRARDGWPLVTYRDGVRTGPRPLTSWWVAAHLVGRVLIAPVWLPDPSHAVAFAIIDLDVHDGDHARLQRTLGAVLRALGDPPHALIRSSSSRGLHLYLFFARAAPTTEVRRVIVERLLAAGVAVVPGSVEVYPPSSPQPLRLPLGRGSCILDPETLAPIVTVRDPPRPHEVRWVDRRGHPRSMLIRDVPGSISLLARLAGDSRIDLGDLRRVLVAMPGDSRWTGSTSTPPCPAAPGAAARSPGGWSGPPPAALRPGERYHGGYRYLWSLRGTPLDEALGEYERWLRSGGHTSHDLSGPRREATIRRMIRDARGVLRRWERDGVAAAGPSFDAAMAEVCSYYLSTAGRDAVIGACAADDVALLARVPDSWLHRRLGILVGLLRLTEAEVGPLRRVTIGAPLLHRIAGGKLPPKSARFAADPTGETWVLGSARRVLSHAAGAYGIARRLDAGIRATRAALYEVLLPPAVSAAAEEADRSHAAGES